MVHAGKKKMGILTAFSLIYHTNMAPEGESWMKASEEQKEYEEKEEALKTVRTESHGYGDR